MYKIGIYIMYMYEYIFLSYDKCFEIFICIDNLNKQNLVIGSVFLLMYMEYMDYNGY